jgi:ATPase subunit of ABC transporter with duplicated ATPase domains
MPSSDQQRDRLRHRRRHRAAGRPGGSAPGRSRRRRSAWHTPTWLLHDAGAHDAQARAQALILGLGFKTTDLDNPVDSFSGGWRMRLQLARALMCPSDLLLLDEPTNHLDLDALVWLEAGSSATKARCW